MIKTLEKEKNQVDDTVVDLINKMFQIAGHDVTYDDIKDRKDDWYSSWTMTEKQTDKWIKWGQKYLTKKFKMSLEMAKKEMDMFNLMFGLKNVRDIH